MAVVLVGVQISKNVARAKGPLLFARQAATDNGGGDPIEPSR